MAVNKFEKAFKNKTKAVPAGKQEEMKKITVGAGLLGATQQTEMETIYVLPAHIFPSEDNKISMNEDEIEQLAESILEVGMLNPPILKKIDDNKYIIVCGERRYRATLKNIQAGKRDENQPIKCSLFNPELINLPLNEDEKEDYVRDVENAQQRNKTDGDKLMLMRKFKERYEIMREREPERFKGVKTRELLAGDMDMSGSAVAQFQKVENQGSEALKKAMVDGKVNITAAVELASEDEQTQEALIERALGNSGGKPISKKDITTAKFEERHKEQNAKKQTNDESEPATQTEDENSIMNEKVLKSEMKEVFKILRAKGDVKIEPGQLFEILKNISNIEKIIKKL